MQDAAGVPGLLGEMAQMGDHVVAGLGLDLGDPVEVEPGRGLAQRRKLFAGDRQPELGLGLGQRDPKPAPQTVAVLGGKELRHFGRGVALVQGILRSWGAGGHIQS